MQFTKKTSKGKLFGAGRFLIKILIVIFVLFLGIILLDKIHYRWKEASDEYLEQDKRWCQRVILESLSFPNFITLRNDGGETILPSLKQKTNAINNVLSNYGILYLNSIYEDFKNNESTYCIVLNGDIGMQFII